MMNAEMAAHFRSFPSPRTAVTIAPVAQAKLEYGPSRRALRDDGSGKRLPRVVVQKITTAIIARDNESHDMADLHIGQTGLSLVTCLSQIHATRIGFR
jgi:hypothetical protein